MAPYHHMMVHFPIVLLALAFVLILLRALTKSDLARRLDSAALVYCLVLGIAGGVAALITGMLIWPVEGSLSSTMGRNKILIASWMLAVWSVVLVLRWRVGEAIWNGTGRYLLLGLGAFGAILVTTTATLGGHLLGNPSRFSGLLHQFGWNVYQTYYAPTSILVAMLLIGVAAVVLGVMAGGKKA